MEIKEPFDPLNKLNLGHSVADALLGKHAIPLQGLKPFEGAGVYAIYYTGDFSLYAPIKLANAGGKFSQPIYVGKAVPSGARKGGFGLSAAPGAVLYKRLAEHLDSVRQVSNLDVSDFYCRHLTVEDIWIPLGESLLIEMFKPLWNMVIDGFGNHDPGGGRYNQKISSWDTLHPGRSWASRLQPGKSLEQITIETEAHFKKRSPK